MDGVCQRAADQSQPAALYPVYLARDLPAASALWDRPGFFDGLWQYQRIPRFGRFFFLLVRPPKGREDSSPPLSLLLYGCQLLLRTAVYSCRGHGRVELVLSAHS